MQNTDGLDRQDHESFHAWAKRIQNAVQYYETCSRLNIREVGERPPYPRSHWQVNRHIDHIRTIVSRLPNRWYCANCKDYIDIGWGDDSSRGQAMRLHFYSCHGYYTHHVKTIQNAFRRYIERKNDKAARIIQKVVIPWLYRPGSPLVQKAGQHFYGVAESQV